MKKDASDNWELGEKIKVNFFSYKHFTSIMINDKSVSVGDNSFTGNRTTVMGVTSRQKFQNMEKLTTIVREMQQNSSRPAHPEQILEAIKNNIKNSYNRLYDNYEANKNTILKSIQQTETNDANEGVMKQKFESVLKEKNAYDRLKVEVEKKQKKLKKLMEIRDQALLLTTTKEGLKDTLSDRAEAIRSLQDHRSLLEYEAAVLEGMKKQREQIKLSLKERSDNLLKEEQLKKEKIKKIIDTSHTKKIILDQIQQKIRQEDLCQIPLPLSEELQRKLQQYQGKHTQQNILIHEKFLNEQKSKRQKYQAQQQQELVRKMKQAKDKEQKRQYQIAYSHFLLKQAQQQQIKKFCRVQSITQIANGSVEEEKKNLEFVKQQIENQIRQLDEDNRKIRRDIEMIMTNLQSRKSGGATFLELEKIYEDQQTQLRRIKSHALKKQKVILEWEGALQTMFPVKNDKMTFIERLKISIPKYEGYSRRIHAEGSTAPQTYELKPSLALNRKYKESHRSYQNQSSQASEFQI